jgi:hypothetical protein
MDRGVSNRSRTDKLPTVLVVVIDRANIRAALMEAETLAAFAEARRPTSNFHDARLSSAEYILTALAGEIAKLRAELDREPRQRPSASATPGQSAHMAKRSLIAAALLAAINNGLNLIGANPFIYDVVCGVFLLLAVTLDALASNPGELRIQNS